MPLFVLLSLDSCQRDGGMFIQGVFDLPGEDTLSVAQQHVFLALDDGEETILVHAGDVAGGEPAIVQYACSGACTSRIGAAVSREHLRAAHP